MAEEAVKAWQEHLRQCVVCKAVVGRGEAALMYNLCPEGRQLYHPAWRAGRGNGQEKREAEKKTNRGRGKGPKP